MSHDRTPPLDDTYFYDPDKAPGFLIRRTAIRLRRGIRRVFLEHGLDLTPGKGWGDAVAEREPAIRRTPSGERRVSRDDSWLGPVCWPTARGPECAAGARGLGDCQNWGYRHNGLADRGREPRLQGGDRI